MAKGKVIVVNKYKCYESYVYIGRGSPFGNYKYKLSDGWTREEAIEGFRADLRNDPHPRLVCALERLIDRVRSGETIRLGCTCKPKACHGDVLKEYIEDRLEEDDHIDDMWDSTVLL